MFANLSEPLRVERSRSEGVLHFFKDLPNLALLAYFALYTAFGALTVGFYPSYAWPGGDEAAYYSAAMNPWTLIPEILDGYRPKEMVGPYTDRIFEAPFSIVFALFGFTVWGARMVVFSYGLGILALIYWFGCRMMSRWWALAAVVLLSVSPQFLYHSHGVRPEGMLTLVLLFGLWRLLRREQHVPGQTYFLLGFTGSLSIMVHLNGVILPPIFLVTAVQYDWPHWSWRKLAGFFGGCVLAAAIFLVVDFLPGLEKVRQYGVMPVTYISHSKVPILQGRELISLIVQSAIRYAEYFEGKSTFERQAPWLTLGLILPALLGLFYRASRMEHAFAITLALLTAALLAVIPNARHQYLFYLFPAVYLFAIVGLSKLPRGRDMRVISVTALLLALGIYGNNAAVLLRNTWQDDQNNRSLEREVRQLAESMGPVDELTVMGTHVLHACLHDTRFRTFHGVIYTKDFEESLNKLQPDLVILDNRSILIMYRYMAEPIPELSRESPVNATVRQYRRWRSKGLLEPTLGGRKVFSRDAFYDQVFKDLLAVGYYEVQLHNTKWNDDTVVVYTRRTHEPDATP